VMPGQTLSVSVTSTIAHPGWWRIALHEGASSTQTLTTLPDPVPMAGTNCTPAIMMNPVWSPTQPVLADGLPAGSGVNTVQSGSKTFQVTIPQNANCTTAKPCSLQVIMVMTDHPPNNCYYHHCADISSQAISTDGGMPTDAGKDVSIGSGGSGGAGGASTGGGGSGNNAGTGGSTGAGGSSESGTGGATGSTSTGSTATTGPTGTTTSTSSVSGAGGSSTSTPSSNDNGCSCRLASRTSPSMAALGALVGLALATRRRRRR
jgi:MYXO-CTERM domain-containing protein